MNKIAAVAITIAALAASIALAGPAVAGPASTNPPPINGGTMAPRHPGHYFGHRVTPLPGWRPADIHVGSRVFVIG